MRFTYLFLSLILFSCSKEEKFTEVVIESKQITIETTPDSIRNLIFTREASALVASKGYEFTGFVNYAYTEDASNYFFELDDSTGSHLGLSLYVNNDTSYLFLFELSPDAKMSQDLVITNVDPSLVKKTYQTNNLNDQLDWTRGKTCRETSTNFSGCMDCAVRQLTDNWAGIIACGINPGACAAAALLHCGGLITSKQGKDE